MRCDDTFARHVAGAESGSVTAVAESFPAQRASLSMVWIQRNWDIAALVLLAALVFHPWNAAHLPLTDFGIFLAARGDSHSLWSQFVGIASNYMREGRFCIITFIYLTLGSATFGTWAPGWHWTYFALNIGVILMARGLFRKLGISRMASFVALALWALMGPTAELWFRPAGEAIGLILLLAAMHLAFNYTDASDYRRRAILIALCALGIVLAKEMLVALLPAGWLFSRMRIEKGEWSWAAWRRRDTYLFGAVALAVLITAVPIAWFASHAPAASYAKQYAGVSVPWAPSLLMRLELVLVPTNPRLHWLQTIASDPVWSLLRVLPNILWIAMVVIAILAEKGRRIGWPVAIGATWVGFGLLAYLPWPGQGLFYMMPFALGTMFVAAHALNVPLATRNKNRRAVFLISMALIVIASIEARTTIDQYRLRAELNSGVIDAIAKDGGADVLIAAMPVAEAGTGGWSNHLRGFAWAEYGVRVRESRDMSCGDAVKALSSTPRVVVVSAAGGCGQLAPKSVVIAASGPRYIWPMLWRRYVTQGSMFVARNAG